MASSLHLEIQNLKDALAASQNKVDRYAHLIATLSEELVNLRNNICHSCKKKTASSNASVPTITISAPSPGSTSTTASLPLWRRVFQGRRPSTDNPRSRAQPNLLALPQNTTSPSEPEAKRSQTTPTPTHPGPDEDIIASEQKPTPPKWSVVRHPEVKPALDLHLAHSFTYDSPVFSAKLSRDGQRLAVGVSGEAKTFVNELKTGSTICGFVDRYVKLQDRLSIWSVRFSPDGQLVATGASDNQIRIWDVNQKRLRASFKGHKDDIKAISFSPTGRSLISGSDDRSVRMWNMRDGSSTLLPVIGRASFFLSVAFSPNGRYIAAGCLNNSLWIWDSRKHALVANWLGHKDSVRCTEFTPDGKGLMSGGSDQTVKCWDVSLLGNRPGASTGTVVDEQQLQQSFPEVRSFVGHTDHIRSISFFPGNTRWVVTGSDDRSVRVWDIRSGVCELTLQGNTDCVREVDISQNFLAIASKNGLVTLWKYELL